MCEKPSLAAVECGRSMGEDVGLSALVAYRVLDGRLVVNCGGLVRCHGRAGVGFRVSSRWVIAVFWLSGNGSRCYCVWACVLDLRNCWCNVTPRCRCKTVKWQLGSCDILSHWPRWVKDWQGENLFGSNTWKMVHRRLLMNLSSITLRVSSPSR